MIKPEYLRKVDYILINGKPHFGFWFGRSLQINIDLNLNDLNDPCTCSAIEILYNYFKSFGLEIRYDEIIKKSYSKEYYIWNDPLNKINTISLKCVLFGRAYKVVKLLKKGRPNKKRVRVNGRIKRR